MDKIVLIRWDMKLGPQKLIQFPPEEEYPTKEILLKIWARHELAKETNFVTLLEPKEEIYYCSLLKLDVRKNQNFLIILKLNMDSNVLVYREILESVADDMINNLDSPQFGHIIADIYRIIINQSEMDESQLFFRLFQDKNHIEILQILRQGVLTKSELKYQLQQKWGIINLNLDLLISPFLRLGLIKIKDITGAKECIFLIQDVYCCRLPPTKKINNPDHLKILHQTIENESILSEESVIPLMKLMQYPGIKELISLLHEDIEEGMPYDIALTVVKENPKMLDSLVSNHIIFISEDNQVFMLTHLHFQKFDPKYLPQILTDRYLGEDISFDQLLAHVTLLCESPSCLN